MIQLRNQALCELQEEDITCRSKTEANCKHVEKFWLLMQKDILEVITAFMLGPEKEVLYSSVAWNMELKMNISTTTPEVLLWSETINREFRDGDRLILCRIQCLRCVRPHGIETLPKGIISRTSDLEMRSLSGPDNKKIQHMEGDEIQFMEGVELSSTGTELRAYSIYVDT
ncbi:hypothetical protein QYF36_004951 [Acer negundo]|nr:hypothetical protein QYF36_004951 [Acer negundo]